MFHLLLIALALVFDAVLHRSPGSLQCAKLNNVECSDHKMMRNELYCNLCAKIPWHDESFSVLW